MSEEYPENTFIGALHKAREAFGMALIRIGADIVMKNNDTVKLYIKYGGEMEIIGTVEKTVENKERV